MKKKTKIKNHVVPRICSALMLMLLLIPQGVMSQQIKSAQKQFDLLTRPGSSTEWIDFRSESNVSREAFLNNYLSWLQLAPGSEMRFVRSETDKLGYTHSRYQQYINNVKVSGGDMIIHEYIGAVTTVNGKYLHELPVNINAALNEASALNIALKQIKSTDYLWLNAEAEQNYKDVRKDQQATMFPNGELIYMRSTTDIDMKRPWFLCWKFDINVNPVSESYSIYVDAGNGSIINKIPLALDCSAGTATTLWNGARTIYTQFVSPNYRLIDDCQGAIIYTRNGNGNDNGSGYSNYTDADNTWGATALQQYIGQTHWGVKQTYNYYSGVHSRNSYDDAGQDMISYLNPGYTGNAYWVTAAQAGSFGGSSTGGNPYTTLDVNGHEHSHGVDEHTCNLTYSYESGALNESFADIFGEMVESYALGIPDWIHRAEIGGGNRSFIDPKAKGQPDTYLGVNWYVGSGDNGGVHTNSGVQNYWFYILSEGGTGTNDNGTDYNITGIGRFIARDICYYAMTHYLSAGSQYIDSREATLHAAYVLYGGCSAEIIAVGEAWRAVGVESQSSNYTNNACGSYPASGTTAQAIHILTAANGCSTTITASASTVYFSAVDRVVLYPGFQALPGSKFYAYLEPCAISMYKNGGPAMSNAERGLIEHIQNNTSDQAAGKITVGPNPANDIIKLNFVLEDDAAVRIDLYDALGNKLVTWDEYASLSHGYHQFTYSTEALSNGIYLVNMIINGQNQTVKFIKQD